MKFFINAGHAPGIDPGAINHGLNQQEADIAKDIAEYLTLLLRRKQHNVMSVQDDNLNYVTFRSNSWNPDLFVSVHCNSYDGVLAKDGWHSGTVSGTEVLVYPGNDYTAGLGQKISKVLSTKLGIPDRGIKLRPELWVLRRTVAPAILIETAFIDNDSDCRLLMARPLEIAMAICDTLT